MTLSVGVLASGRGSNFAVLADHAARGAGWRVTRLLTDRPEAGALHLAAERGIPAEVVSPTPAADFAGRLTGALEGVDLVLLAGYLRLIPAGVVAQFQNRILNLHPALLPAFGGEGMYGMRVHKAVLESGARVTGATVHLVDEVYDRGRILAQWPVPVQQGDTPDTLAARVHQVEHRLYPAVVDAVIDSLAEGQDPHPPDFSRAAFALASELPTSIAFFTPRQEP
jgi:phosphoribosylglycinamide formyltransferase-1